MERQTNLHAEYHEGVALQKLEMISTLAHTLADEKQSLVLHREIEDAKNYLRQVIKQWH